MSKTWVVCSTIWPPLDAFRRHQNTPGMPPTQVPRAITGTSPARCSFARATFSL